MDSFDTQITWLGHASFRISGPLVVYIDPWQLSEEPPADLILVTHDHRDHFSQEDIDLISTPDTIVVCPTACAQNLRGQVREVQVGDMVEIGEVTIQVVPAYNTDKPNHPKSAGHVGYVIEMGGERIYHAGDTDLIPEMSDITCDIALLPVGGTYTMNAEQAAQAAERIGPQVVIPMHWGRIVGDEDDVRTLRQMMPQGIEVIALEPPQ